MRWGSTYRTRCSHLPTRWSNKGRPTHWFRCYGSVLPDAGSDDRNAIHGVLSQADIKCVTLLLFGLARNRGTSCHLSEVPNARASIPAEILTYTRAAYPQCRSSNANSLEGQKSAGFPANLRDLSKE